jgi:hypothetical protein
MLSGLRNMKGALRGVLPLAGASKNTHIRGSSSALLQAASGSKLSTPWASITPGFAFDASRHFSAAVEKDDTENAGKSVAEEGAGDKKIKESVSDSGSDGDSDDTSDSEMDSEDLEALLESSDPEEVMEELFEDPNHQVDFETNVKDDDEKYWEGVGNMFEGVNIPKVISPYAVRF